MQLQTTSNNHTISSAITGNHRRRIEVTRCLLISTGAVVCCSRGFEDPRTSSIGMIGNSDRSLRVPPLGALPSKNGCLQPRSWPAMFASAESAPRHHRLGESPLHTRSVLQLASLFPHHLLGGFQHKCIQQRSSRTPNPIFNTHVFTLRSRLMALCGELSLVRFKPQCYQE